MYKVGITGGIGSGKTTICKIFESLGIPVFYSDVVAKEIMIGDLSLINDIKKTFGNESYFDDGNLNRKHIADIVFNNKNELSKLNNLVHPRVFESFNNWISHIENKPPYVLKEAALLFESDAYKMCDTTILVTSPLDLRVSRVMKRDNASAEQVKSRMNNQMSDEDKMKLSNNFIINDESHDIHNQVISLHKKFLKFK